MLVCTRLTTDGIDSFLTVQQCTQGSEQLIERYGISPRAIAKWKVRSYWMMHRGITETVVLHGADANRRSHCRWQTYHIHVVFTGSGIQFAGRKKYRLASYISSAVSTMKKHRTQHSWINRHVERMNRTLKEEVVKRYPY